MNQTNEPSTPSTERVSTPLMEIIEYLEKYKEVIGMTAVMTIDKAKSLLPKERKRIIDDFDNGQANWEEGVRDYENGLDYFNKTFKQ